jgi:hypothetical protein
MRGTLSRLTFVGTTRAFLLRESLVLHRPSSDEESRDSEADEPAVGGGEVLTAAMASKAVAEGL